MRVGILTFHASHNYGSMLQAYALQQVVMGLGHECEIINFRTKRQRKYYQPFWNEYPMVDMLKAFIRFPSLSIDAYRKYILFERFLTDNLKLSAVEYTTWSELEQGAQGYDAYISGSDQIWNVSCFDWDLAYTLDFVKNGRKIAYAPSMGPVPENEVLLQPDLLEILGKKILDYHAISVREVETATIVANYVGYVPKVTLDPTLLLPASKWRELESDDPIVDDGYILLYTPWLNNELYHEAVTIGKNFNLRVVVTLHYEYTTYRHDPDVIYKEATGPKEFINLISHARLVIGASFHATAFALIFGRQLYAYKGMEDSRVLSVLNLVGLDNFACKPVSLLSDTQLDDIYASVYEKLSLAIGDSMHFLSEAIC